mgnify:CR=1 FL=1
MGMNLRRRALTALLGALITPLAPTASAQGAERVVAIGGAVTEIVYELGRGDWLVAADSTSTHPAAADELPDVGYMRQLSAEPILSLDPDLVVAVADAGPPVVFDKLRSAGVTITRVPDATTPEGVIDKVTTVARALDVPERGQSLARRLETRFESLGRVIRTVEDRPDALVLIAAGAGNIMAAGRETSAAGILELAGARQAIDGYTGYRPLSAEAVVAAEPDWIVLTQSALSSLGGRDGVRSHPALGATPAARAGNIAPLDGLLLLGFGPRTPAAASRLASRLHPGLPVGEE